MSIWIWLAILALVVLAVIGVVALYVIAANMHHSLSEETPTSWDIPMDAWSSTQDRRIIELRERGRAALDNLNHGDR